MKSIQMFVEDSTLKEIIFGINQVCTGIANAAYDSTLEGIYNNRPELPEEENARIFLDDNYELTAGVFRLMAAASEIVVDALVNGDIDIVSIDDAKKIEQQTEGREQE